MANKIRQINIIAGQTYLEWIRDSRQIVVLVIMFFLSNYTVNPIISLSKAAEVPINLFEPFLANINSNYIITIILFCFLVLISDFPRMEGNNGYFLIRTDRKIWLWGKLLFAFLACITYVSALFLILTVKASQVSFFADGWSYIMKDFYTLYQEIAREHGIICIVQDSIYNNYTPFQAFWFTILLLIGMLFSLCLIMMIFNLCNKKIGGIITNIIIIVYGFMLAYSHSKYSCVLPVGNIMLQVQNTATHTIVPISVPFIYFAVMVICLLILNVILVKRVTIQKDGER